MLIWIMGWDVWSCCISSIPCLFQSVIHSHTVEEILHQWAPFSTILLGGALSFFHPPYTSYTKWLCSLGPVVTIPSLHGGPWPKSSSKSSCARHGETCDTDMANESQVTAGVLGWLYLTVDQELRSIFSRNLVILSHYYIIIMSSCVNTNVHIRVPRKCNGKLSSFHQSL